MKTPSDENHIDEALHIFDDLHRTLEEFFAFLYARLGCDNAADSTEKD